MKKKSVRRPVSKIINSDSHPSDLPALMRSLSTQTHLELMELLQHPLYRHVRHQMTHADIFKHIMEIINQINIDQGVVR